MTHGAPASCAAVIARQQLFERRLRLDDEGVGAGPDQRLGLLGERAPDFVLGEVAVRLHQAAKRPDISEHPPVPAAERRPRDFHARPIDGGDVVGMSVAVEHDARTAERVGDDAVRPRLRVAPLDGQHALGMSQVPRLAAVALLEPGDHQLRAHRSVAEQRPLPYLVLQTMCHRPYSSCSRASVK